MRTRCCRRDQLTHVTVSTRTAGYRPNVIELAFERTIPASPAEVFARLADLVAYAEWLSDDSISSGCMVTSAGTIGRGSTYLDKTKMGNMVGEITEHDPHTLLEFRQRLTRFGIPVFEATQTNELSACNGGTLLRHRFKVTTFGPFRLMERAAVKQMTAERERVLDALQQSFV
jgi:uncharacterized protein YndB with AHSA1/START domain